MCRMSLASPIVSLVMRALLVLAAGAMTGCAESGPADGSLAAAAATAPAAGPAPAPAAAPEAAAATPRPTAAGRNMFPPPPAPPAPAPAATRTVETARAECWMKLEADRKAPRDLDKRVKLVETCVTEKMSGPPPPAQH